MPMWKLKEAGVTWPRGGVSGLAGSGSPLEGAQRRSQAQTHARAAGAFRGAFLSLRSAPASRRVRSLPEARAGAQGSPLTAAVGVDLGGRGGGSRMCLLPLPPLLRIFSLSEREVPSFCGESRLYRSMPRAVAGLWRTRLGPMLRSRE